jgi:hypothetical protein
MSVFLLRLVRKGPTGTQVENRMAPPVAVGECDTMFPMAERIQEFADRVVSSGGSAFLARAFAEPRANVWIGWLEFQSSDGRTIRTGEETSQPSREAVAYWASGLEPVYLEGALARAK